MDSWIDDEFRDLRMISGFTMGFYNIKKLWCVQVSFYIFFGGALGCFVPWWSNRQPLILSILGGQHVLLSIRGDGAESFAQVRSLRCTMGSGTILLQRQLTICTQPQSTYRQNLYFSFDFFFLYMMAWPRAMPCRGFMCHSMVYKSAPCQNHPCHAACDFW